MVCASALIRNPRMVWVARDLKDYLVPATLPRAGTEYLTLVLLSINSEGFKGWFRCLSSRKFPVNVWSGTNQGEIHVTVVSTCAKCYKHIILWAVLTHLADILSKLCMDRQKLQLGRGKEGLAVNYLEEMKGSLGYEGVSPNAQLISSIIIELLGKLQRSK